MKLGLTLCADCVAQAVARLDGLDPMVMFGTGGHTGHSALLVHHPNGQLYVCESTAANPFGTVCTSLWCDIRPQPPA